MNFYVTKEPDDYGAFLIVRLDQISSAVFHPHPHAPLSPPLLIIKVGSGEYSESMSIDGVDAIRLMKALNLEMPSLTSEQIRKINEKRSTKAEEPDLDDIPFD